MGRIGWKPILRIGRTQDLGTPYKKKTVAGFLRAWGSNSVTSVLTAQILQLFQNTAIANYWEKFWDPIQSPGAVEPTNLFSMRFWETLCNSKMRGFNSLSLNYGTFLPTYVRVRVTFKPDITNVNWNPGNSAAQLANVYFFMWAGVNPDTANQETSANAITRRIFELPGFKKKPLMPNNAVYPVYYVDSNAAQRQVISRPISPSISQGYNLRKLAGANWLQSSRYSNQMNHAGQSFTAIVPDLDYHQYLHVGLVVDDAVYAANNLVIPAGQIGHFTASVKVYGIASNRRMNTDS